jgi:iron complex outermembrane receptor protein
MGIKSKLACGTAFMAMIAIANPAWAQTQPESPSAEQAPTVEDGSSGGLEDIVVTGRKRARAEDLQEVPLSVTALSSEQLQSAVALDLVDVGRLTPNASLQESSQRGIQNFAIRGMGISGSTPSDEPAVGIFQDGIYWGANYGALGDLFDVEGVEILRGPQGTLFGRNVTGGAVAVRSARPTSELSAEVMAGVGTYGLLEASMVMNGGTDNDLIAGRLAVQVRDFTGYFTNTNTGKDYGGTRNILVRPSLRLRPTDTLDITLIGEIFSEEGDPTVVRGIAPNTVPGGPLTLPEREGYRTPADYWSVSPDSPGFSDIRVRMGVLDVNWEVAGGVLTSVTGIRDVRTRVQTDFDGTPSQGFLQGIRYDQNQISTELRYAREVGDWLNFTIGVYHFDQHLDFGENRVLNNRTQQLATNSILDNDSQAAFAEADVTVLPGLQVTLGGRYTRERKVASAARFGACTLDFRTCTYTGPRTYSGDNFSPRIGASYRWGEQMVFASFTRGFRSGGFSLRGTPLVEPYLPETVSAYEAGFKSDLLGRRLRFNGTVFHNEFSNLQRTVLGVSPEAGVIQSVFNAADATIQGLELELTALLTENLTLAANYGYTDANYQTFLGVANPQDREFVRVPKHTAQAALTYQTELANGGSILGRVSASYTDSYFYDDPNLLQQDAYTLIDATISYTTASDVTFTIYGKNLTEAQYAHWGSTLGPLGQNLFPGAPRTFGVRVSAGF